MKQISRILWTVLVAVTFVTSSCDSDDDPASSDAGNINVDTTTGDGAARGPGEDGGATASDSATVTDQAAAGDAGAAEGPPAEGTAGAACTGDGTQTPPKLCMTGYSCVTVSGSGAGSDAGSAAYTCRVPCTPQGTCSDGVCCPAMAAGQTVFVCTPRGVCPGVD